MIAGLIAQHVPTRADGCPGWFGGRIEGRRSVRRAGRETIRRSARSARSIRSIRKTVRSGGSPDITPPLEYGVPTYKADGPITPPEGQPAYMVRLTS